MYLEKSGGSLALSCLFTVLWKKMSKFKSSSCSACSGGSKEQVFCNSHLTSIY